MAPFQGAHAGSNPVGTTYALLRATLTLHSKGPTVATKDDQAFQVSVERQKAAQAAGNYDLADLPGQLAEPHAAARVGKAPKQDKVLKGGRSMTGVAKLSPGSALAVFGRPESRWAMAYWRRTGGTATMPELLSYARQLIGMTPEGTWSCACAATPVRGRASRCGPSGTTSA
jgi:hypothetical protein